MDRDHSQTGLNHLRSLVFFTGGHSITGSSSERKFLKRQFHFLGRKLSIKQVYASHARRPCGVIHYSKRATSMRGQPAWFA